MNFKVVLVIGLATFMMTSCAHRPKLVELSEINAVTGLRAPASADMPEENFETDVQAVLHSTTAASDLLDRVHRLVRLHQRAQQDLSNFDDDLDEAIAAKSKKTPVTDRTNKTYSRLVTLMMMTHVQRDRVAYMYARLLDISADGNDAQKAVASQTIGELKRKARLLRTSERVFLQDLLRDLTEVQLKFEKTTKAATHDESFEQALFVSTDQLNNYYDTNRDEIDEEITDTLSLPDPKVDAMTESVHAMLNASGLRSPQSSGVKPSVGPDGNLTGREFPAGTWAFTFDDGPSPLYTHGILDNLDANGMKGTFFWLAQNTKKGSNVDAETRALNDGMQPQCHSYTHANLAHAGQPLIDKEVIQAVNEERKEYGDIKPGYQIKFFRCPYGSCLHNQQVRQQLVTMNLIHAFWDVDTLDWQDHNPASIVARAQKQMAVQKRGIILFHDVHPQSVVASGMLMKIVKGTSGLRTVTLPQMIQELNDL